MFGYFTKDHLNEVLPQDPVTKKGGLYIGDWNSADDVQTLVQKQINFVLSALPESIARKPEYPKHGITQMIVSAEDMASFDMRPFFEQAFEFISQGLKNGNVLVHCAAGISRSSTLTLVYLMRVRHEGFNQSLAFLRTKRPICTPNHGFTVQLKEYAKKHGLPE